MASKQAVRRVHLVAEMMRLESRLRQGEAKLEGLRRDAENCARAAERLISHNPVGAFGAECPDCWILDNELVRLRSDTGGSGLRCDKWDWRYGAVQVSI